MKINKNIIVFAFLLTPLIASFLSTVHIVDFFNLGNPSWMSYLLAITFEIGSIASFVALSVLDKIKKNMVVFIFVILFFMQLIGNVYFSFSYVNEQLKDNTSWMHTFIELVTPVFQAESDSTYKFILAMMIGIPIPLVSLSFLKSLVDYLDHKDVKYSAVPVAQTKEEPTKIQEIQEESVTKKQGRNNDGDAYSSNTFE